MARILSKFANLYIRQIPNPYQLATSQIRSLNLSVDQIDGNSAEVSQKPRNSDGVSAELCPNARNADEVSAELTRNPDRFSAELSPNPRNPGEVSAELSEKPRNVDGVSADLSCNLDDVSSELSQTPRNPDEVFAQNQIFRQNPQNPLDNFGQDWVFNASKIVKDISDIIQTRPKWEETLLSDFQNVKFGDPTVYNEILEELKNALLSLRFLMWIRSINGSVCDHISCNTVFKRLVEAKAAETAKSFLDESNFEPEPCDLELYIRCLCESGLIDDALYVFGQLKRIGHSVSLETCNWALAHSVKNKRADIVWKLYEDMTESGIVTDMNTMCYLVRAFCLDNNVFKAYDLLQQILQAGHVPEVELFNHLITALCRKGKWAKVSTVLHSMIAKNCSPDLYTYQRIINALSARRMVDESFRILNELKGRGYSPNRVMYTTVILALCRGKKLERAKTLWLEMTQQGIIPDESTYCTFIQRLWISGYVHESENLYKEMLEHGYGDTSRSKSMLRYLCLNAEIKKNHIWFEQMKEKGIPHDLIQEFCRLGKLTEGLYFCLELLKQGLQPSRASFSLLIKKLSEAGKMEEAEALLKDVRDRGLGDALSI